MPSVVAEEVDRRDCYLYLEADGAAELLAEVNVEHAGRPIRCRPYHLPAHLPPPFNKWPDHGGRFIVYPPDQIVRQPNSRA